MDFGFNSTIGPIEAGYGSEGSTISTPRQATAVKGADNSWLSGALSLLNTAAPVAAAVIASKQAKSAAPAYFDPSKTAAPVIGLQAAPTGGAKNTQTYLMLGGGIVALLLVVLLVLKKK
jgi:hypothetical protein